MPPAPEAAPQPAMPPAAPHTSHLPLWLSLGAAVLLLAGLSLMYWQKNDTAPLAPSPKKIGVISLLQVKEADSGFKAKLAELGYIDVEYLERQVVPGQALASDTDQAVREFVAQDVDLLYINFEISAKIALDLLQELGRTDIPIVFGSRLHEPVSYGLVASLRSSGNNATGVATNLIEIIQRHMEFLKQINPEAKNLGIFAKGFQIPAVADGYYAEVKRQAPRFGFEIVEYTTDAPPPEAEAEFNRIAAKIKKGDIDALMHIAGHYYVTQEIGESKLAIRLGIPMATNYEDIPRGGHFTYSNGTLELGAQLAVMADKIFRGTAPRDIPVEYAQKGILSLHLGRAREAGLTFPDSMLFIAEKKYEDDSAFEVNSLNR
jgi:ABC-type uncharacterized transport system substrate-binding protein